jgi:hypothetical protein
VEEFEAVYAAVLLGPCCELEVCVLGWYGQEVAYEREGSRAWVWLA